MTTVEARRQRLQTIYERDGTLMPEAVISDAKKKTSPLHDYFTWDDGRAAHLWRIEQARRLIRSVRISVVQTTHTLATPHYVRDPDSPADTQGFVAVPDLATDQDRALRVVQYETRRAVAAMHRAAGIADTLGLEDEVQAAIRALLIVRDRAA